MAKHVPWVRRRPRAVRRRASAGLAIAVALAAGAVPAASGAPAAPAAQAAAGPTTVPAATITAEHDALARARTAGEPVPVDAETDPTTLVAANPDGTLTMTVDSSPVRTRQNGAWVPIDPTLLVRPDGTIGPKASATGVTFSAGGTGPMATLSQGSQTLSWTWPGRLPAPVLSGADATYRQVLPGVDLVLTADAGGFSELLVVADAKAAANPALRTLSLGMRAQGLRVSTTADGGAVATDASGATVFHSDTATMWDSTATVASPQTAAAAANGPNGANGIAASALAAPTPTAATHQARVAVSVSADALHLVPDASLLTAPTTKFPLYIDPAWGGGAKPQLHWARISDNGWNVYDSTSTGANDHPREGFDGWANNEKARTYYSLNTGGSTGVTGIGGATVTAATLYVNDYWAASHYNTPVNVWSVAPIANWNSTGLTWSNKPGWGTLQDSKDSYEICGSTTCTGVSPGQLAFNITPLTQAAAKAKASSMTLGLGSDETNRDQWKQLASGGGASISVTYYRPPTLTGGTGAPATTPSTVSSGVTYVTSHTPTMKLTATDADGENVRSGYEIWHWANGAATTAVQTAMFSAFSANGGPYTFTGSLPDGTYAWRGSSESVTGHEWSPWSAWQVFTVDTTAPAPPTVNSPQFPKGVYGGSYGDSGQFTLAANGSANVKGYIFALDGDLGTTVYGNSNIATWTAGTVPVHGKPYWVPAGTVPSGFGSAMFAPGTVGPHQVFAKSVDAANNTSAEVTYLFYAGLTTPTYAYGNKMVTGFTAANGTVVPPATAVTHSGAHLITQANCCGVQFADPSGAGQAQLADMVATGPVAVGDTATFSFDIPAAGYWDLGANLTMADDYGQYSLTLDTGTAGQATLLPLFDAYHPTVTTNYRDFGAPKNAAGTAVPLSAGLHTLTLTITGKNAASGGYQAGVDVLRLAPMSATCAINNLTSCLNNTAVSQNTNTAAADADGYGASLPASELAAAGWNAAGTSVTINGAPMTMPGYKVGAADNIVASGQLIEVPATGVANDGDAVVFVGFATSGTVNGATGVITYTSSCGGSTTQSYTIDTTPSWTTGSTGAHVIQLAHRNLHGNTQDTLAPQIFAMSVPLACPGQAISSIQLPVVSDGVVGGKTALHLFGVGIRASSFTDSSDAQTWTGSYAAEQDALGGAYTNTTFRVPAALTYGGTSERVRLSNALGRTPVTFSDVTLAPASAPNGAAAASTPVRLTFGGAATVTVPAGGEAISDAAALTVGQQSSVLVSATISGSVAAIPIHDHAKGTAYFTADGADHASDTAATAFTGTGDFVPFLTGVDVSSPGSTTGALALYGDQAVNSDTASGDGVHHLSDLIAADEAAVNDGTVPFGVLSLGRDSFTTTNNAMPPVTWAANPLGAIDPVDRTVLDQSNVRTALIATGTSDILAGASADTVQKELISLAQQIRNTTSDTVGQNPAGFVTVYVATIPPDSRFTAAEETVREAVNNYILCGVASATAGTCTGTSGNTALGSNADGAIDFAAAVAADGTDTGATVNAADLFQDSNGKYWPNNDYYAALAQGFIDGTTGTTSTVGIDPMIARHK